MKDVSTKTAWIAAIIGALATITVALIGGAFTLVSNYCQKTPAGNANSGQIITDNSQTHITNLPTVVKETREGQEKTLKNKIVSQDANESQCFKFTAPVFNPYNLTFNDENTPLCHDFPIIDVAMDTPNPRFAQSEAEYNSIRKFNAADQLVVLIYINNGADSSLDRNKTTAKNVKILTSITNNGNLYKISATFTGDNMKSVTGSVNVQTGSDEFLEIIPKSGFTYTYDGYLIENSKGLDIGNPTLDIGILDAGMKYSLFFSYKVRVMKKQ